MALARLEPPLGVERRHAAGARRRDRLTVRVVLDVARREDARDVRLGRAGPRHEVARVVVVELVEEERRRRVVPDRDEQAAGLDLTRRRRSSRSRITTARILPSSPESTSSTTYGVTESRSSRWRAARSIMICDARNSLAPVDDGDLRGELGQEDRLLHRRVAAADHDHLEVAVERAVARRAVGDAACPVSCRSDSSPSCRAVAPVATITASAWYSSSPTQTRNGSLRRSRRG